MKQQANTIYRIVLHKKASVKERREFQRRVQLAEQLYPGSAIISDWPRDGEEKAFVVIRKDENFGKRRAAYLVTAAVNRAWEGAYGGRVRTR